MAYKMPSDVTRITEIGEFGGIIRRVIRPRCPNCGEDLFTTPIRSSWDCRFCYGTFRKPRH